MNDPAVAAEAARLARTWGGLCLALLASAVFWGFLLSLFLPLTPLAVGLALLVAGLALLRARLLVVAERMDGIVRQGP